MQPKNQNSIVAGNSFLTWGGTSIPLINAFYDVTNSCNLYCRHCFVEAGSRHKDELHTKEAIDLLDDIALLSPSRLTITGGEPLLRKDFLHIVQHASSLRSRGIGYLKLTTNGTLVTKHLATEITLLFDQVNVSIDGFRENHDYIRGVGSFEQAINGLRFLVDAGCDPKVSITITRLNIREIPDLIRYLNRDEKVSRFNLRPVWNYGRAKSNKELSITSYAMNELCTQIGVKASSVVSNGCNASMCLAGYTLSISSNGDIYHCVFMRTKDKLICNSRERRIVDLYVNSPIYIMLRQNHPKGCILLQ